MPAVACPKCGTPLSVPDNAAGRKVRCPQCQTVFTAGAEARPPTGAGGPGGAPGGPRRNRRATRKSGSRQDSGLWIFGVIGAVLLVGGGIYLATSGKREESHLVRSLRENPSLQAFVTDAGSGTDMIHVFERHDQNMTETTFGFKPGTRVKLLDSAKVDGRMYVHIEGVEGSTAGWVSERNVELRR